MEDRRLSGEGKTVFIKLEAPAYLEDEQNLYDQPPFSETLSVLSAEFGLDISGLRGCLSRLSKVMDRRFPGTRAPEMVYLAAAPEPFRKAILRLEEILQDCPYWFDYLGYIGSISAYKSDGSRFVNPNKHGQVQLPVESYTNWVHKKLELEGKIKAVGIEEIFPQDFADQSPVAYRLGKAVRAERSGG